MKLNQVPNFRVEDYQSEQSWINRLFVNLNPFIQAVNQVLNGNVDFLTNIKSVTKDYDISNFQPFDFTWPYQDAVPNCVEVIKSKKGSSLTPTILLAAWEYDATDLTINITRMLELTDTPSIAALSGRYQFTIRATV